MKTIDQEIHKDWSLYHGDNCEVIKNIPDESIHQQIFSPPFLSLFTYSNSERDMGNNKSEKEFWNHFDYLIPELFRINKSGRLVCIHCMNVPTTITHDGYIGLKDFRGNIIKAFQKAGFIFHAEVMIWKDPLVQAVRTKNITLAHKQIVKDSAMCGIGLPDYIVVMRKPGENQEKISHPNGFEYYIGEADAPNKEKKSNQRINKFSHEIWQKYASPVWWDIRQTHTLNAAAGRSKNDEKHVCALQLDTISRCLELWSNKNDIILDPFAGIGSTGYQALKMNRKFLGCELKNSYFKQAVKNLKSASKNNAKSFFK